MCSAFCVCSVLTLFRPLDADENMLEVHCPALTPDQVLRTSGHVAKFTDLMCKYVRGLNGAHAATCLTRP